MLRKVLSIGGSCITEIQYWIFFYNRNAGINMLAVRVLTFQNHILNYTLMEKKFFWLFDEG